MPTISIKQATLPWKFCKLDSKYDYTWTLESTAEPNGGEHTLTLSFSTSLNIGNVEWWLVENGNDIPITDDLSLLFTSAGEVYTIKARLSESMGVYASTSETPVIIEIPYTVYALYAPAWAGVIGKAMFTVEPVMCGLSIDSYRSTCNSTKKLRLHIKALQHLKDDAIITSASVTMLGGSPTPLAFDTTNLKLCGIEPGSCTLLPNHISDTDKYLIGSVSNVLVDVVTVTYTSLKHGDGVFTAYRAPAGGQALLNESATSTPYALFSADSTHPLGDDDILNNVTTSNGISGNGSVYMGDTPTWRPLIILLPEPIVPHPSATNVRRSDITQVTNTVTEVIGTIEMPGGTVRGFLQDTPGQCVTFEARGRMTIYKQQQPGCTAPLYFTTNDIEILPTGFATCSAPQEIRGPNGGWDVTYSTGGRYTKATINLRAIYITHLNELSFSFEGTIESHY